MASIGLSQAESAEYRSSDQSDNINLALRQAGHMLYKSCGDDYSQIPPVEKINDNEFRLKLDKGFDYDKLPEILDASLKSFGVNNSYIVSILTCESENIILGYNDFSFENQVVACKSREEDQLCKIINLKIQNDEPVESKQDYNMFWLLLVGVIPLIVFIINRKKIEAPLLHPIAEEIDENQLTIGSCT